MRVVPPITITSAMLTSSTCAEPAAGEAAWNSGTTYAIGAVVISTTTHRKYESRQGSNTNKDPTDSANAAWWGDIGPTLRWAMFDLERSTGTTPAASPLTVVVTPGQRVDAIGLVGLDADSVSIGITVSGSPVYSYASDLSTRETFTWYDYFFGGFSSRAAVALFNLPPYSTGVITVTLVKGTAAPTCGGLILGQSIYLGSTVHGAEADASNFSKIDRDDFGTATLTPRRTVPRTIQNVRTKKAMSARLLKVRDDLNAAPALWSGLDDQTSGYFEPLLILGIYKRFTLNMDQPADALLSLELEEV